MNIKNLKANFEKISTGAKYILCTSAIVLGVATGLTIANSKQPTESVPSKELVEMTYEEQDENYAMLQADFKNTELLGEEGDIITFVKDGEYIVGGLKVTPTKTVDTIALSPGDYKVRSQSGETTSFTVEDIDQNFTLDIDYANQTMKVAEKEHLNMKR